MNVVTGERGCGKTTELILEANIDLRLGHKPMFLVSTKTWGDMLRSQGLDPRIPTISYSEFKNNSNDFRDYDIFIDEIECFLRDIIGKNLVSISCGMENQLILDRKNWSQ